MKDFVDINQNKYLNKITYQKFLTKNLIKKGFTGILLNYKKNM